MPSVTSLSELIMDRLLSLPNLTALNAEVPNGPAQGYAVFYPGTGQATAEFLGSVADGLDWPCYVVCVGYSPTQCTRVADQVRDALTGWRPIPDDRSMGRLAETQTGATMQRDDAAPGGPRWSLTLRYTLTTNRS